MSANRKRILFLIASLRGGGAERFFTILLRHLDRDAFELHLALLQAEGEYLKDLPTDVAVHDLKCSRARYALPGIVRVVGKLNPRAVLSTLPQVNMALVLCRPFLPRGTRLFLSEATLTSATLADDLRYPWLWTWLYRRFYKHADKVVCLSESMIDDMAVNFNVPREKLIRIYYPVDLERVRAMAAAGRNPYPGPGPHLVAAGRLCPQKGFDLLLAAMPAVRAQFPEADLTILGQGPLLHDLTEQARRLGLTDAVHFVGFQQNPWTYLACADVFVLSSRWEGLPNILLEAMALGTPIVATDCPGSMREVQAFHPEIVMVLPEDAQALANGVVAACRAAWAENARVSRSPREANGMREFSVSQIVGEYSKLFLS